MPRYAFVAPLSALLAIPLLAGGCVQQSKYDELLMANRSLNDQMVHVSAERDEARANLDSVRNQLSRATSELDALQQKYGIVASDLEKIRGEYDSLGNRLASLSFGPLPEDVEFALQQLAKQHPDLLTFDASRGMLRFASDFTFGLGSAELSSQAMATLSTLANILNSSSAAGFEVRVYGHTDNVPIAKADTRRNHPTNLHLSAHRSISVRDALVNSGVGPERFMVAGYGEFRPVVPNPPKGGAAQNRRVEILLAKSTEMSSGSTSTAATSPSTSVVNQPTEPMK